jgi:hypothetical protein
MMITMHDAMARKELAALLRARRDRLELPGPAVKRRTPSLRREGVADRAGVSVRNDAFGYAHGLTSTSAPDDASAAILEAIKLQCRGN